MLFPGQGSQTPEMAAVVATQRPDLLSLARRELGADPFEGLGEGGGSVQPAIYCASLACWERAGRPRGAMIAGHSLGELAALVAAGALDDREGLRLAVARGRLMEEEAAASPGGMIAVLGESDATPAIARRFALTVANDNAPGQVVLSGPAAGLEGARRELRAAGLKVIRLRVAGAFHSPAMARAAVRFRAVLVTVSFRRPAVPVFSSTMSAPFAEPRADLAAALTGPVRWRQTVTRMYAAGAREFVEVGPGDILTGLVGRTLADAAAHSLAVPEVLHA
ncbi:MAG TPA: ACP S-malonyltransferase [Solirubrobacterales bacterium]|nr:ACP S-malonyltransferase [Solirubrobacterales bacterium]